MECKFSCNIAFIIEKFENFSFKVVHPSFGYIDAKFKKKMTEELLVMFLQFPFSNMLKHPFRCYSKISKIQNV